MENSSSFFANRSCAYYPCHEGADPENFNCLFCYCPLYAFGESCPGDWAILENGVKDCSNCLFPHRGENYQKVLACLTEKPGGNK